MFVGTLAYVAPERFQGESTERSDVYSLGLTLHEMLTLQRAFTGADRVSVMNQVANDRLPRPREVNSGIPRDLETIVMKAASRDPRDRYESAGEMALDLDAFLEDRPIQARRLSRVEHAFRWCRRNRSMAALAASVVFLLATVFGVTVGAYVQADKGRRELDATAKSAVKVLENLFIQFASVDHSVPGPSDPEAPDGQHGTAPLPISKDVAFMLEGMLPFYDEFSRRTKDSQFVAIKSISATGRMGDIHSRLGETVEAQRNYEDALHRIENLSVQQRDTLAARLEAARIHNGLGMVLIQRDDGRKEAAKHHREAISLVDNEEATEAERFELARSLYLLHLANRRHDRKETDNLHRAETILGQLDQRPSNRPEIQFLLARCLLAHRTACSDNGALNENQAKAISILETLVNQSPDNPEYQFELGDTFRSIEFHEYRRHGKTAREEKQLAKSVARLRRALEVTANLDVKHPNIPQYNRCKKRLHHLLAAALYEQKYFGEAADEYLKAIDKQKLVVSQSNDPHWQQVWLSDLQLSYAKLLRQMEKYSEARKLLDSTAGQLEKLALNQAIKSNHRHREHAERVLAQTYLAWASVEKKLNNFDREQELLQRAENNSSL